VTGILFAVIVFISLVVLLVSAIESWRRIRELNGYVIELRGALELHQSHTREHLRQLEQALEHGVHGLVIKEIRNLLRKR
jgi:hypothetical protein